MIWRNGLADRANAVDDGSEVSITLLGLTLK